MDDKAVVEEVEGVERLAKRELAVAREGERTVGVSGGLGEGEKELTSEKEVRDEHRE